VTPVGVRRLAILVLVLSAAATAFFVRRGSFSIVPLVAATAAGCAAYVITSRRPAKDLPGARRDPATVGRLRKLLPTAFFLLTAGSIALLLPVLNEKPFEYYVLASASAGVLGAYILLASSRRETAFGLGMVVVLALNLLGSNLLAFSGGMGGADSSTHIHFLVAPIVATGALPALNPCGLIYGTFPAHHLLAASGSFALGLDIASAYYGMGFLTMLLPVLVAFLVARRIFGVRTGLLAAMLLAGSSYFIAWASHAAPITYALPLIAACILILLKIMDVRKLRLVGLAIPLGLALILTHPYSSLIFGVVLLGIVVGHRLTERDYRPSTWGPSVVAISFAYTLLIDWTNYSCLVDKSFRLLDGYVSAFAQQELFTGSNLNDALPLPVILANTVGDSFLFALAAIGFLGILHRRVTARHMLILGPLAALLGLSALGLLTRLEYILPNRIYVFLQFVGLAPLAAFGVRHMARRKWGASGGSRRGMSLLVAGLLLGGIVFASSTSIIAGFETSPFVGTRAYTKLYNTAVEHDVADWMCARGGTLTRISTSASLHGLARQQIHACVLPGAFVGRLPVSGGDRINVSALSAGTVIVFSRYDLDPGFQEASLAVGQTGTGVYTRLDPDAPADLDGFHRLYDAGQVQVFRVGS
jgi:hypothetical protein